MKTILCSLLLLTIVFSCSKKDAELATTEVVQETTARKTLKPDVVYHYKGKAYPLYYVEGSTTEVVQDENALALEALSGTLDNFVTFKFSNQPENHLYWFDSEFDGYDYMEKHDDDPIIGRKAKTAFRIDELRTKLVAKYGKNLNYHDSSIYEEALAGVKSIFSELNIVSDLPRDLEAYIGKKVPSVNSGRMNSIMKVFEHGNYTGSELEVETAPNTVIWSHGDFNCYTTAANPNLSLEFQANGNNWDDCISSTCINFQPGADAIIYAWYKDYDYAKYTCSRFLLVYYDYEAAVLGEQCFDMPTQNWTPVGLCGHMNDQISSIRIKAIWENCPVVYNDL